MTRTLAFLLLVVLASCTGNDEAPSAAEGPLAMNPSAASDPSEVDVVVLGGTVRVRPMEAPRNADPDRVWELIDPIGDLQPGTLITDALPIGEGWVVVKWSHDLWYFGLGESRRLDRLVNAPIAVRDSFVVYARGQAPTLEVVRVDVRDGQPEQLTEGYAPVWNPALGPTGEVIFMSGRDGGPALYRVERGQQPERLADEGHFPSSLEPPRFDGRTLFFHDEAGQSHTLNIRPVPATPAQLGAGEELSQ